MDPKATAPTVRYPDVHVQLTGQDGNAFALIGQAFKAIRQQVGPEAAAEFSNAAIESESYDGLLAFIMQTVNVT